MIKSDKGNIELEGNLIDVVADLHVAIIGIYDSLRENNIPKQLICKLLDESIMCALKEIEEKRWRNQENLSFSIRF